ncbi:efflux RND transporter periplasmic adaptor subunit [Sinomicrobium kalidii]|uniref:efflux RND transporter periplasmic adaptor subunit n=1 Tax=Sinomicrobium kalidii TaxID=2900738 RepID=UPI001E560660|nr:efflux RND transporter periplasmic adaptor subunit [Sinomicrobium kalidii]UGU15450.1 efflux RND transporter periplasmic adaptor subunit [Sinomicrobium kalidii]
MKIFKIIFCSSLLSVVLSCQDQKKPTSETEVIPIKTTKVVTKNYASPILSSGVISSEVETNLSFKTAGYIDGLYAKEGEAIKKGQLLATINPTEINARLATAKSDYEMAAHDFERIKNLYEEGAATREEFDQKKANLNSNLQHYNIAKFNRKYTSVYANTSGTVMNRFVNEGEFVSAGTSVYRISSTDKSDWVIELGISDKDWTKVKVGDTATVTIDAYKQVAFKAFVSEVGSAADPSTGTFKIKLKIDPGHHKLVSGLVASVKIFPSQTTKLQFIPSISLTEANGYDGSVYIPKGDKKTVEKRKVKIAFIDKHQVAISAGLEDAGEVVTDGASYLSPDARIIIKNSNP